GNSVDITLLLEPLENEHNRLVVWIISSEGYFIDRSYSEWYDT
ncbi:unnamed protein product, partial [marine sediment metagenome]